MGCCDLVAHELYEGDGFKGVSTLVEQLMHADITGRNSTPLDYKLFEGDETDTLIQDGVVQGREEVVDTLTVQSQRESATKTVTPLLAEAEHSCEEGLKDRRDVLRRSKLRNPPIDAFARRHCGFPGGKGGLFIVEVASGQCFGAHVCTMRHGSEVYAREE